MKNKKIIVLVLACIGYTLLIINSYKHIAAELSYERSIDMAEKSKFEESLANAAIAAELNNKEPRYFYNLAKIKLLTGTPKEEIYKNIETAIDINPKNLVTLRNVSPYYYFLSLENLDISENQNRTFDPKYRSLAKEFLFKLKTEYPNDLGVQILIAKNEKRLEFTKDYYDTLKKIATLREDVLEWHPDLK